LAIEKSRSENDCKSYRFKIDQIVYKSSKKGVDLENEILNVFALPHIDRVEIAKLFCTFIQKEINLNHLGDMQPIQVYLHAPAAMRDVLMTTSQNEYVIQYSDVFRILSMTGNSPICSFYLSLESVTSLIDVIPILRTFFSPEISMSFSSSLTWKENEWGIPFINKIYDVQIDGVTLKPGSLVHMATNFFIGEWFWKVKEVTRGVVDLKPRNRYGECIPLTKESVIIKPQIYEHDLVCHALSRCI